MELLFRNNVGLFIEIFRRVATFQVHLAFDILMLIFIKGSYLNARQGNARTKITEEIVYKKFTH